MSIGRKTQIFLFSILLFYLLQDRLLSYSLKVHNLNFRYTDVIKINEGWLFSIDERKLLEGYHFKGLGFLKKVRWMDVSLPYNWAKDGRFRSYSGIAWYVYLFRVDEAIQNKLLAIELGYISDVDEVYLNGVLIGKTGRFVPYKGAYDRVRIYPIPISLLKINKINILAIKVGAFYTYDKGLIRGRYLIGDISNIIAYHKIIFGIVLSIFVVLISSGIYFLAFYIKKKDEKHILFYSLFSILYGIYSFFSDCRLRIDWFSNIIITKKIEYSLLTIIPVVAFYFVIYFFRLHKNRTFRNTANLDFTLSMVLISLYISVDNVFSIQTMLYFLTYPFILGNALVILWIVIFLYRKREKYARSILFSIIALFICMIHDILLAENLINTPLPIFGIGMSLLSVNIGVILSNQFIHTFNTLKSLRKTLEEKIVEQTETLRKKKMELERKYRELQSELEIAKGIQKSLLPPKENIPSFLEVVNLYMPMEVVSGDFFYYGFLNEDKWFMYMVDVSGHGIPAALIASMAKSSFSSKIEKYKHHLSPSRILQEVNKDFLDLKGRGFLTACFIVYDAKQKKITYSNAGHTLPIYLPKEHSANIVYMKGVPLGIKENPVYRERILFLKPGDRVFFYTDGIIEVANEEGELFGEERLKHIIERERNLPLVAVVNMIITEYWLYNTKLYQEDDITLVAIEIL